MPELFVPVDLAITGIVDDVDRSGGDRLATATWRDSRAKT
jgi:hypothetical protein